MMACAWRVSSLAPNPIATGRSLLRSGMPQQKWVLVLHMDAILSKDDGNKMVDHFDLFIVYGQCMLVALLAVALRFL